MEYLVIIIMRVFLEKWEEGENNEREKSAVVWHPQ